MGLNLREDLGQRGGLGPGPVASASAGYSIAEYISAAIRTPTFMFSAWILISLVLYQFGWSTLTSGGLDARTLALLGVAGMGFLISSFVYRAVRENVSPPQLRVTALAILTVYYVAAFWRNGGVPLLQMLRGDVWNVYGFGLPGLQVFALALTGYLGVRAFGLFLAERHSWDLFYGFATLTMLAMIASRSAITYMLFCWFVLLIRRFRLTLARGLGLVAVVLVLLFIFGAFGDARLAGQILGATGHETTGVIKQVAHVTGAFEATGLPVQWLWAYIYLVSPLVNLNSALVYAGPSACGQSCDISGLVRWEMLPDVVSRHVGWLSSAGALDKSAFLPVKYLTVVTTFGPAIGYAGMIGAILVGAILVFVVVLSYTTLRGSLVREEGLAILACILFFSFFANMISYSPLVLQLALALVHSRHRVRWL